MTAIPSTDLRAAILEDRDALAREDDRFRGALGIAVVLCVPLAFLSAAFPFLVCGLLVARMWHVERFKKRLPTSERQPRGPGWWWRGYRAA